MNVSLPIILLALVSFSACKHADKDTNSETKAVTLTKEDDLFVRTVSANLKDDIAVLQVSSTYVCDSPEVYTAALFNGLEVKANKKQRLSLNDQKFVTIRSRVKDSEIVEKQELSQDVTWVGRLLGYKDEVVTVKEKIPAKYNSSVFVLPASRRNELIAQEIMHNRLELVNYRYDRSKVVRYPEDSCVNIDPVFVKLISITVKNAAGETTVYDFN